MIDGRRHSLPPYALYILMDWREVVMDWTERERERGRWEENKDFERWGVGMIKPCNVILNSWA